VSNYVDYASFVALIDDDEHSAHLLTRALVDQGAHGVQTYGDAIKGLGRLKAVLSDTNAAWPALIILDLKDHSGANLEFLDVIGQLTRQHGVPVVVLAPQPTEQCRQALMANGAAGVFVRHAERDAYRRVAADIVEFVTLAERPEAVGM
jgi:DNA-binding response OmpR family regulator